MLRFSDIPIKPKLVVLFLLTGIVPLVIVGLYGSKLAMDALMTQSFDQLVIVHNSRKENLEQVFRERVETFRALAENREVQSLARMLVESLNRRTGRISDPGSGGEPDETDSEITKGQSLKRFLYAHDCFDVMLVSADEGYLMYSAQGKDFLWTRLGRGIHKQSGLTEVWRRVIESGSEAMVDFSPHMPENGLQSAFYGYPIINASGKPDAVLVVQIVPSFVNEILRSRQGMGKTGESYLIGRNPATGLFEFRSDMRTMGEGRYVVGHALGTSLKYWTDAESSGLEGNRGIYTDSYGNSVIVAYNKLAIAGPEWYLVSKIDTYEVESPLRSLISRICGVSVLLLVFIGIGAGLVSSNISRPIIEDVRFAKAIARGDLDQTLTYDRKDEFGKLAGALNRMAVNLRDYHWIQVGRKILNSKIRGHQTTIDLARAFISFTTRYMEAKLGAFYIEENGRLRLHASYAFKDRQGNFNTLEFGEGLVGQAAIEREIIFFSDIHAGAPAINYGAGEQMAAHYAIVPLVYEEKLIGVFMLGAVDPFTPTQKSFLEQITKNTSILLKSVISTQKIKELLETTRHQQKELEEKHQVLEEQARALKASEAELLNQQEELRVINEELEEQARSLKESESQLQAQQEELEVTNEELEEHTQALESQKKVLWEKNQELIQAQEELGQKAAELEIASRYKSEFLANMSHELRTPLNSILILSKLLADNAKGNLSDRQVESAITIHSSGSDLLNLINDILDLSKVEAGKIELFPETVEIKSLVSDLKRVFNGIALHRGLSFDVVVDHGAPATLVSDPQRLQQILRNLLSNAFKFTEEGTVSLTISRVPSELTQGDLPDWGGTLAFAVRDDGIGIPADTQAIIFEAFQQADGGTSRTYGGTGLGLSISRELAKLLGGTISLESTVGKGSTFTLILPEHLTQPVAMNSTPGKPSETDRRPPESLLPPGPVTDTGGSGSSLLQKNQIPLQDETDEGFVADDRRSIRSEDKTLLIIEDDPSFQRILRNVARDRGFKCVIAENGETGLHFADYYHPCAIILDVGLPGINGRSIMERLQESQELRKIPVHLMSDDTADAVETLEMGGIGFLAKPVGAENIEQVFSRIEAVITRPLRNLLIVEDDAVQQDSIRQLIAHSDVKITVASTGREAYECLCRTNFDCMILDLGLSDMSGFDFIEKLQENPAHARVPVIVYTGRDLTWEDEKRLRAYTESIIIKGVKSPERLLEESALFLHRVESNLPKEKQKVQKLNHDKEAVLSNKTVLIVDDDMRNVFALTNALEERNMKVIVARNGLESIQKLRANPGIDVVLMDIMMPKMDGYEAMETIRREAEFKNLPIIALTAKAMKGDRNKCMEAGASDYLAKPVNTDKLLSMLRVWLYS